VGVGHRQEVIAARSRLASRAGQPSEGVRSGVVERIVPEYRVTLAEGVCRGRALVLHATSPFK
jgi:hypothetical protein